jgi:hypothetical protein
MEMTVRRLMVNSMGRGIAAAVVIGLLVVCAWSLVPAAATETGCPSFDHELRVCGQSVTPDQIAVVAEATPVIGWEPVLTTWPVLPPAISAVSRFEADPSVPRAPPLS